MEAPLLNKENQAAAPLEEAPRGNIRGLAKYFAQDFLAGFLVFLIALPLCLGIAAASGFPPIAGVFTAIIGGILTTFLSNSELTIKGPAAGLIVILLGCVIEFGGDGNFGSGTADNLRAYRMALGIGVAAGILQILFGLLRSGSLGEFFPTSAVHGMLAAIGLIIISKQFPITLGEPNKGEPLELLLEIPYEIMHLNPIITLIGATSLIILFGLLSQNRAVRTVIYTIALLAGLGSILAVVASEEIAALSLPLFLGAGALLTAGLGVLSYVLAPYLKKIPSQMLVILVTIPMGFWLDLSHTHTYHLGESDYVVEGKVYLVPVPDSMVAAITTPDFSGLETAAGWKWVIMFALIGSLESLLSGKAIDTIDPYRRKTDLNRDLLAVGVANTASSFVGGLPMITEIVRSKANIDNGARTRFANMYHGLLLLVFVALAPWLIQRIPLAALGAMLVYTGYRLASPYEFAKVYKVGLEQFAVFVTTIIAVLATDLLIGIAIGIALEFILALASYPPIRSLFVPDVAVDLKDEKTYRVRVRHAAVFTNWILLRRRLVNLDDGMDVEMDLSETHLVDHTVMEKLHDLEREFEAKNRRLTVTGLENHRKFSKHPHSGRRRHSEPGDVLKEV